MPPKIRTHSYFGGDPSISADGDTALVSSGFGECCERKAEPRPEVVYVYERTGEKWNVVETVHNTSEENFGKGIALSEDGTVALIREQRYGFPQGATIWTR